MSQQVTMNGTLYNSDDFAGYGYLTLLFPAWEDMLAEMAAAATVNGVSPGAAGNVLTSTGAAWTSASPASTFSQWDAEVLL